jgi:hypothetical protein
LGRARRPDPPLSGLGPPAKPIWARPQSSMLLRMATAAMRPWRVRPGLLGVRAYLRPRARAPTCPSPCSTSRPSPALRHRQPLPSRPPWPPPLVSLPSRSSPVGANRPRQELRRAKPHLLSLFPQPGKHRSVVPAWRLSHWPAKLCPLRKPGASR